MASLQTTADSVRVAVNSASTCTPATVSILSELLLPKPEAQNTTISNTKKPMKANSTTTKQKTTRTPAAKTRTQKIVVDEEHGDRPQLSPKERSILATEIINATLKSLSEAIKAPAQGPVRRQVSSKDLVKSSARKALRRSSSLPQSPLQPRSLNRVTSFPDISSRHSRSSSSASITSSGHRSVAECARIAFSCLRTLQAAKVPGVDLPPLQLENGMSVLVGKLVSLGLDDLAIKELRILKRRLDSGDGVKKILGTKPVTTSTIQTLAELLDYGKAEFSGAKLGLVITSQLQALRLMTSCRKPKVIEEGFEILHTENSSSPTRLLLLAARESKDQKQTERIVRQMQTLSEILLSLCPSISSSEDALAQECRLSICPEVSFKLQTLALHNRFIWWGLAGHKGDQSKEILDPFLRCLSAFARRSQIGPRNTYRTAALAVTDIHTLISDCSDSRPRALRATLAGIFRLLSSLAREAEVIDEAVDWTLKWQKTLDPGVDSEAKRCSVLARLVALKLQVLSKDSKDEEILLSLLEELERPFKGESSEIDELMTEISGVRRSAISVLAQCRVSPGATSKGALSDGICQMCESVVFLMPRLSLRYLGTSPDTKAATKDILRYEQRRQFINKSALHAIDSGLFLIKMLLGEGRASWELVDSKLQDCALLCDRLDPKSGDVIVHDGSNSASYHVRISNLYYTQYLNMRRNPGGVKDGQQMRALRRSIDSIRQRPQQERRMAQFSTKLERMADYCKTTSRYDELFQTLLTLRDELISDGALDLVVEKASDQSPKTIWNDDDVASILGRTIHSLLKVQLRYLKGSAQTQLVQELWSTEEKGAVLEHQLDLFSTMSAEGSPAGNLFSSIINELLLAYDPNQYPIRRLRILIRRLSLDVETDDSIREVLQNELQGSYLANINSHGTNDEGLQGYLDHYKSLAATIIELAKDEPELEVLKQGLATWFSIRSQCPNLADFEKQVEDVAGLLTHLSTIGDYLQMKGLDTVRVAALRLIAEINEFGDGVSIPDDLVLSFTHLGSQWLQLGYSGKAGLAFDRAMGYAVRNGVTSQATLQLHLSHCQYLLAIGSTDKVEDSLAAAQAMYADEKDNMQRSRSITHLQHRTKLNVLISNAYLVYSSLALERGSAHIALSHAKQCVRLVRRAWTNIEEQDRRKPSSPTSGPTDDVDKLTQEVSQLSMSSITLPSTAIHNQASSGANFWALVTPLFRSLNHLASIFAHHGMFQETIYYAEQAHKLAKEVGSNAHLAMASAFLGSTWLKAGVLDRGSELLMEAKQLCSNVKSRDTALLSYHLGNMHGLLGEPDEEISAYSKAEATIESIGTVDYIDSLERVPNHSDQLSGLEDKMVQMTITKRMVVMARKTPARAKVAPKRKTTTRAKSPVEILSSVAQECPQLMSLTSMIARQKARALVLTKKFADALIILQGIDTGHLNQLEAIDHSLAMAKQHLLHSLEQMNADPVYSVLQDSTISFPSVTGLAKTEKHGDRLSVLKASPPKKGQAARNAKERAGRKSPLPDSFFDKLRQAQEQLTSIQSIAIAVAPVSVVHTVSALLNSVAILLSAAGQVKGRSLAHPGLASSSIENARTLALRRERKAIQGDPTALKLNELAWPKLPTNDSRRSSIGHASDLSKFQREYVDIIPKAWTVISISLSDSRQELSITKLQAGHSPFVLRLPLGRHNSMDADEEVFGFEQGQAELLEIIEMANESAHDAVGMTGREAKTAWWEEREGLDLRLRDLLENIEKVWLGGFTGIFSQHARRPELLARFQKSFQNILDRHLPSRRKTGRKGTGPRITLDSRILELFIGLGDASDEQCDFSEPLTDLLYFVVDVLQFHGELNAYAEIDFDSIVIEMHDALRGYYSAVHTSGQTDEGRHTILVLDKALHSFPWESLPCMDGLAVSRLPSLGCLRDRILTQQKDAVENAPEGHYISLSNASYILNPGGDLKHTQSVFQKPLQNLNLSSDITNREPSEEEVKDVLESKDLLLYFGHGSGAQYIRAREIKKLDKCAVTILMGCSSGALVERGEFEPHGPPVNYMHAGCPALVATLWDVTDKDIDRFAKSTFENWGLFEADKEVSGGRKGKGREKKEIKERSGNMVGSVSLVEAVAKGRSACHLRYLNASAVCVYGVPVYFR
ncbi:related to cell division-associated protein [Rhynchosporium graminicola]|uniref:separase n=1 Tax=Rhynchosporium graminicola TaxID=2792576 RepID=A0A1E1K610_9HELO|nr:related to cell division-associated protein [Rhynchosporium commune]